MDETSPAKRGTLKLYIEQDAGQYHTYCQAFLLPIQDNVALCSKDETWRCILVQQRGRTDGVLVMPEDGCFVGWAAYYSE